MTGDYAHSDGSHVPVRSRSVPWGGGGRWERRPWSGGAAVRRGGGRRGGWTECGSPASRAPRQAPWGAWRAPLGPQFTSPAPPTSLRWHRPPQAPLPFFRRSTADKSGGGKGGAEQARRGDKGAPRRAGTRFPPASPGHLWARPLGELSHSSEERLFQPRTGQHEVKGACCLSRGRAQGFQPTSLSPVLPPVNPVETAGF